MAVQFGVGFHGRAGLLSGRIVIPIRNRAGDIVAYAGRAIDGRPPKYKLPGGFRKGLEFFNLDRALATGSHTASLLAEPFERILLMLDGDAPGRRASRVMADQLSGQVGVVVIELPDGAQPDQLSRMFLERLLSRHLEYGQR